MRRHLFFLFALTTVSCMPAVVPAAAPPDPPPIEALALDRLPDVELAPAWLSVLEAQAAEAQGEAPAVEAFRVNVAGPNGAHALALARIAAINRIRDPDGGTGASGLHDSRPTDRPRARDPGGVDALMVALAPNLPCPAPARPADLVELPTGCPAPYSGFLYSPEADQSVRTELATLDAVAEKLDGELRRCRSAADRLVTQAALEIDRVSQDLATIAALLAEPPERTSSPKRRSWPWAAGTAALGMGAAAVADAAGASRGYVLISGAGAALVGVGVTLAVELGNG